MTIKLRQAVEADFPEILDMIKELALFEKAPEKVSNSVEQMRKEKDFFKCILAEDQHGNIMGIALYFCLLYRLASHYILTIYMLSLSLEKMEWGKGF